MKAIVYTSNTGFTAQYALMLGEKTGLPIYPLADALETLEKGTEVIYMGWLMAGSVRDYGKDKRHFRIAAVCGVGLCDTGCLLKEVRRAISLPENIPLFTLQGGMDHNKLTGIYKKMIDTLIKVLSLRKKRTPDDERMLQLLTQNGCYVREENLSAVLEWYQGK